MVRPLDSKVMCLLSHFLFYKNGSLGLRQCFVGAILIDPSYFISPGKVVGAEVFGS